MTVLHARLALLIVGIATWFHGMRSDRDEVRWLGIALLAAGLLLRFFRPATPSRQDPPNTA